MKSHSPARPMPSAKFHGDDALHFLVTGCIACKAVKFTRARLCLNPNFSQLVWFHRLHIRTPGNHNKPQGNTSVDIASRDSFALIKDPNAFGAVRVQNRGGMRSKHKFSLTEISLRHKLVSGRFAPNSNHSK